MLTTKKKHIPPIDRIRNPSIQLPCSLSKMVMGGAIFHSRYNYLMKTEGPNIPFDKFANEDLWELSSLESTLGICNVIMESHILI